MRSIRGQLEVNLVIGSPQRELKVEAPVIVYRDSEHYHPDIEAWVGKNDELYPARSNSIRPTSRVNCSFLDGVFEGMRMEGGKTYSNFLRTFNLPFLMEPMAHTHPPTYEILSRTPRDLADDIESPFAVLVYQPCGTQKPGPP